MNEVEVILDSSALLALINSEPGAEVISPILSSTAISAVNFSEVITKMTDQGVSEQDARDVLGEFPLEVVPLDIEQAYDAGILRATTRSLGLSLGDRCCLSLARSLALPVMTADNIWARLSIGVDVQLIR